jgi:hypothetical protein
MSEEQTHVVEPLRVQVHDVRRDSVEEGSVVTDDEQRACRRASEAGEDARTQPTHQATR